MSEAPRGGQGTQLQDVAVQMVEALKDTPESVAGQWANIVATLC